MCNMKYLVHRKAFYMLLPFYVCVYSFSSTHYVGEGVNNLYSQNKMDEFEKIIIINTKKSMNR